MRRREAGARCPQHPTDSIRPDELPAKAGARDEAKAFLFLTVVMAPVIAGLVVAGYGFLVWAYQMFAGPPTG